jgi:hypothetical protein
VYAGSVSLLSGSNTSPYREEALPRTWKKRFPVQGRDTSQHREEALPKTGKTKIENKRGTTPREKTGKTCKAVRAKKIIKVKNFIK